MHLYAYAIIRVQAPAHAEDLVQKTLLAAISTVEDFRAESTERTWLIGILKYKVLDHFRRSDREKPLTDENEALMEKPERSMEQVQFWNTMSNSMTKLRTLYVLN